MPLDEAFHAVVQMRVDDKLCGFGSSWECTSGYDPNTSAKALATAFDTTVQPLLLAAIATTATYEGVYVTSIQPFTNLPYRFAGESTIGTFSGTAAPANLCAVVTLQTSEPSAVRQGRCYISGISKAALLNGTFDPDFVMFQLTPLANALANDLSALGQDFQPRLVQRIIAGAPVGPNLLDVSSFRVTRIPYSQRRRTTRQLGTQV